VNELYPFLKESHYWLSRIGLIAGMIMLIIAVYIGLIRHGDVTIWFRRGVYAVLGLMGIEALIGLIMYAAGGRPFEEVHLIYGAGAVLALPFFVFVERTAKKRPAMGSYIWGFALMAAIILRAIMTGAPR
jgi:heme A synthase